MSASCARRNTARLFANVVRPSLARNPRIVVGTAASIGTTSSYLASFSLFNLGNQSSNFSTSSPGSMDFSPQDTVVNKTDAEWRVKLSPEQVRIRKSILPLPAVIELDCTMT